MKLYFPLLLLIFLQLQLVAQKDDSDSRDQLIAVSPSYGLQIPGADLADDFGSSFQFSLSVDWMTSDNWIIGLQGGFFWGNEVKFDPLASLRGPEGGIPATGFITDILLKERGQYYGVHFGKLFTLSENYRGGIRGTIGAGYLTHKIRLQEDFQVNIPQVSGEYQKGYDHLTGGISLRQFIGYQFLAKNGLINFIAGVEFTQAFTKPLRTWDFGNNEPLIGNRIDLMTNFMVAWTIPFYFESQPEKIFY